MRHTDLARSVLKEETLTPRSLAAEGMATMLAPVERQRRGQEEEEPRVRSTGNVFTEGSGQAGQAV